MAEEIDTQKPDSEAVDPASAGSAGRLFFPCRNCGGFWIAVEKVTKRGQFRIANCPDCLKDSVIDYVPHFLPNAEAVATASEKLP